jgi:hypothetical protein
MNYNRSLMKLFRTHTGFKVYAENTTAHIAFVQCPEFLGWLKDPPA